MTDQSKRPVSILSGLPSPDPVLSEQLLSEAMKGFDPKIVVLDDDPTGVQTVHDISVYTDWTEETIRQGFQENNSMFFILTNSRSFSEEKTARVHAEIAENLEKVSAETRKPFFLISRGDSTLRGHYPLEMDVLRQNSHLNTPDIEILCPFFPEGGRYTFGDIHYVQEGEWLTPAGETEFARDKTFGFHSSDLKEYVEEKTGGRKKASECVSISLEELAGCDVNGIEEKLRSAPSGTTVIVNAISSEDLKVFCAALVQAMKDKPDSPGRHFLARTAAAFPKVMGRVTDIPLLCREDLGRTKKPGDKETQKGGLVIVGSHVKKTTDQLESLKKACLPIEYIEFDVNTIFRNGGLAAERDRAAALADQAIAAGKTTVIYTTRELLAPENLSKEELLSVSVQISEALTGILSCLTQTPGFLIAKGGITSSDVGTKGLLVKKATVMGQIKKGIPVWKTGPESRFPDLPYIIFPGNVGGKETLREIVEELQ